MRVRGITFLLKDCMYACCEGSVDLYRNVCVSGIDIVCVSLRVNFAIDMISFAVICCTLNPTAEHLRRWR